MQRITEYITSLGRESRIILRSIAELVLYMRGGVSYTEAMFMSPAERDVMTDFINARMEMLKDNPQATHMI